MYDHMLEMCAICAKVWHFALHVTCYKSGLQQQHIKHLYYEFIHTHTHTHMLHKEQTWSMMIFITSTGTSGNRECSSVRSCIWQEACAGSIIFAMLCNS